MTWVGVHWILENSTPIGSEDRPQELRSVAVKRAIKSVNEKLLQSTLHKNPLIQYEYNKYMAHHYLYMTKVPEVCEPESYAKASQDAKWHSAMEEEMRALDANKT